jgi:hypothetical protein
MPLLSVWPSVGTYMSSVNSLGRSSGDQGKMCQVPGADLDPNADHMLPGDPLTALLMCGHGYFQRLLEPLPPISLCSSQQWALWSERNPGPVAFSCTLDQH